MTTFLAGFACGVLVGAVLALVAGCMRVSGRESERERAAEDIETLIGDESLRRHERHDAPSETPEPSDPIHRAAQFTAPEPSYDAMWREIDRQLPKSPRQLS